MFTYGDECKPPLGITGDPVAGGGIELKWNTKPQQTGFNIHYRTKGSTSWLTQNALVDNASIYDLPASTDIQLRFSRCAEGMRVIFRI